MQDDLGILRIVLVPAVVEGLAAAGERHARYEPDLESSDNQPVRQDAVIVTSWLEADDHRLAEIAQGGDQAIMFRPIVQNAQATAPHCGAGFDKDLMAVLRDIDGYKRRLRQRKLLRGHGLMPPE
jgi:hypothetical protein